MELRVVLKYCPEDVSDSGVPVFLICYNTEGPAPYLRCTTLPANLGTGRIIPARHTEYVEALMRDIDAASKDSHKAALLMLSRLEAITFGPIRCSPVI
jgi:hypothetical protein